MTFPIWIKSNDGFEFISYRPPDPLDDTEALYTSLLAIGTGW